MSTLDDLITRSNNVLAILENLIEGEAAETIIPDDSVSYPIPTATFDESTGEWTLMQDTADTDGLYKGVFSLAISTGCSTLELISHDVVTPADGIPARYRLCGAASFTDVATMPGIDDKQINKLEIRSQQPFMVKISLTTTWCYEFDFIVNAGGWTVVDYGANFTGVAGQYVTGNGWESRDLPDTTGGHITHLASIKKVFSATMITRVVMTYNYTIGVFQDAPAQASYVRLWNNGTSLTTQSSAAPDTNGTGKTLEWIGSETVDKIDMRITPSYTRKTGRGAVGSGTIVKIRIEGDGINPFGSDNC